MKQNRWVRLFVHMDTFILLFALFLFWITTRLIGSQSVKLSDLDIKEREIKNSEIVITGLKNKLFFKDTTREMRLFLDGYHNKFSIESKGRFDEMDDLYIGDTVRIYTREKGWGLLGWNPRAIRQLERISVNKIFLDFDKAQQSGKGIWILTGLAAIGF